ncbi:methylated-DNA--protein-cysteine methyltransferase [Tachyglossus aculeatus]|uniref:methylated-DNA--protein-cysteine methyltransferase n=1 Tax=Tachyglossus aculeatus TaxID=9261 RepID=UPI0018F2BFAB|nr:methylated-DNA--protein-cysteine methyltransferase [Tachyglossus aculeatus]
MEQLAGLSDRQGQRHHLPVERSSCEGLRGRMKTPCKEICRFVASPVGKIEISACDNGVHEIKLPPKPTLKAESRSETPQDPKEEWVTGPTSKPLEQAASWLRAYFWQPEALDSMPLPDFHHPLFEQDSFTRRVLLALLERVKFGETVSYQQLAQLVGRDQAARAVGGAMRGNPIAIMIPCHRVILSSGKIGNYGGGTATKEWLLAHERRPKAQLSRPTGRGTAPTSSNP